MFYRITIELVNLNYGKNGHKYGIQKIKWCIIPKKTFILKGNSVINANWQLASAVI